MPTRTVYHTILDPNGEPVPDFTIRFTVDPTAFTDDATYPHRSVTVTANESGYFAVDLVAGLRYRMDLVSAWGTSATGTDKYPADTKNVAIVVPEGITPISLADVRNLGAINPTAPGIDQLIANAVNAIGAYTQAEVDQMMDDLRNELAGFGN